MSAVDDGNVLFTLAYDFIRHTARSVFLTGKAGTGKTTFLRYVRDHSEKNLVVAAPTGVAAIHAGGVTLHSLFQLPFGVYLPGYHEQEGPIQVTNRNTLFKNLKLSRSKRDLLQELQLLIIDEVSMVRCDMLDAIDTILKMVRKNQRPFGGVQVLFIGDLYQLSPVAGNAEWNILKEYYQSPFFFHSKVVEQNPPLCIELNKIYRQNEQTFINLLNNIRNNEITEEDLELLNSRKVSLPDTDGYVTLTTHNHKADTINASKLEKLEEEAFEYYATIEGDFPERNFPVEAVLTLKKNARIMFIKNDTSDAKQYFNGKMATVLECGEEGVTAHFDDGEIFELTTETWRNIRYVLNPETEEIEEEVLGSFSHYPIRLAWAITIHKSQGLTFQKAIVDAGSSFAAGQVYVALSRCTSLQGLVLQSHITARQVMTDSQVVAYAQQLQNELTLTTLLEEEKEEFEKQRLAQLFDFEKLYKLISDWAESLEEKKLPNKTDVIALSQQLMQASEEMRDVATKTQQWIERQVDKSKLTNQNEELMNGLLKSTDHFHKLIYEQFFQKLRQHYDSLQSKSKVKQYRKDVKELTTKITAIAKKLTEATWRDRSIFDGNASLYDPMEITNSESN